MMLKAGLEERVQIIQVGRGLEQEQGPSGLSSLQTAGSSLSLPTSLGEERSPHQRLVSDQLSAKQTTVQEAQTTARRWSAVGHGHCLLSGRHRRGSWLQRRSGGGKSCQAAVSIWQPGPCPQPGGWPKLTTVEVARSRPGRRWPQPLGSWARSSRGTWHRGLGWEGLGSGCSGIQEEGITSVGWNRDCGGGRLVPAPGRRAEEWSASGCPRTSLAPARWCHTSCQSLGCLTCCRQRNGVGTKAVTREGERLMAEPADPDIPGPRA